MPARDSLRIAANNSTLDIRGIGGPPSRPADAPTAAGGAETRWHRIHPIGFASLWRSNSVTTLRSARCHRADLWRL